MAGFLWKAFFKEAGLDFSFTEEQERFRKSVREFCEGSIAPRAREIDNEGEIPAEVISEMASFGLLGLTVPKEYGGAGADFIKAAIAAHEIARAETSMSVAVYYLVEAGWSFLLNRYGTRTAKEEILPDVVKGRAFLGIASTEATGGSDVASISTKMERRSGKLVVNGSKAYISGVREAARYGGGYVTVVKTDPDLGHKGLSLCYLPVKDIGGIEVTSSRQMGREGISNGFIRIKNVELPGHYLIGEWNKGFYYSMEGFNCARALVSAACVGAAEKALGEGVGYIKKRKAFNTPLATFEGIQFQLAECHSRLESARLIVHKAAWMLDQMYSRERFDHPEVNQAVAMAKLVAPAAAFDIFKEVMMWHGAYGYTKEAGLERGLRGVASYLVGAEGAQNIMKIIISREILGKEFMPH
jgi:acyl-CoA dehydrogenase